MRKSLLAAITLVVLANSAEAEYTLTDLENIEALILAEDWVSLNEYILANPQLLEGDDVFVE